MTTYEQAIVMKQKCWQALAFPDSLEIGIVEHGLEKVRTGKMSVEMFRGILVGIFEQNKRRGGK